MINVLDSLDKRLFIWLNSFHSSFMDQIMVIVSNKFTWIPFYLCIFGIIIFKLRKKSWFDSLALLFVVGIADQIASGIAKPFFERLRPCHQDSLADIVHIVNKCGGQFGFFSSHASTSFGIATFCWLLFGKKLKLGILFFSWAFVVSYSRIYLGVHFPFDILMGAITGVFSAYFVFWLKIKLNSKFNLNIPNLY